MEHDERGSSRRGIILLLIIIGILIYQYRETFFRDMATIVITINSPAQGSGAPLSVPTPTKIPEEQDEVRPQQETAPVQEEDPWPRPILYEQWVQCWLTEGAVNQACIGYSDIDMTPWELPLSQAQQRLCAGTNHAVNPSCEK